MGYAGQRRPLGLLHNPFLCSLGIISLTEPRREAGSQQVPAILLHPAPTVLARVWPLPVYVGAGHLNSGPGACAAEPSHLPALLVRFLKCIRQVVLKYVGFEVDGIVQDRGEPNPCLFVYDAVNSKALHVPGKHPRLLTPIFSCETGSSRLLAGSEMDRKRKGRLLLYIGLGILPNDCFWEVPKAKACRLDNGWLF